jgi:hypothetical protein
MPLAIYIDIGCWREMSLDFYLLANLVGFEGIYSQGIPHGE